MSIRTSLILVVVGMGLAVLAVLAIDQYGRIQHSAGYEQAQVEAKLANAKIEKGIRYEIERAAAQHRGAVLARQAVESELDMANTRLAVLGSRIDGLLENHRNQASAARARPGIDGAGPDWIGLFGECVYRAQRLGDRLAEVGRDAAQWADKVSGLQGYVGAIHRAAQ